MTTVSFHLEGPRITGFTSAGHSGYAEAGGDIVCAAVTGSVRMVDCALNEVLGLSVPVRVDEAAAEISLRLPNALAPEAERFCQTLLAAMMVYLAELHEEYPDYITVLEV